MADTSVEGQIADFIEWLGIGVQVPVVVIIIGLVIFVAILYIAMRKEVKRPTARVQMEGNTGFVEKGYLDLPGDMVDVNLQVSRVTIKVLEPKPEVPEVEAVPEPEVPEDFGDAPATEPATEVVYDIEGSKDIDTGLSLSGKKYGFENLTLTNDEGLVVASSSDSAEEDAGIAGAYLTKEGFTEKPWLKAGEEGYLIRLIHGQGFLYAYIKSDADMSDDILEDLYKDLQSLIKKTLSS